MALIVAATFLVLGVAAWPVLNYDGGKYARCEETYDGMDVDDCHGTALRDDGQLADAKAHCTKLHDERLLDDPRCKAAGTFIRSCMRTSEQDSEDCIGRWHQTIFRREHPNMKPRVTSPPLPG